MTQLSVISLAVLLTSHAMADIMLQPGYGQRHQGSKISNEPHHPIVQPHETFPHSEQVGNYQQQQAMDPGYHLELHPVYTDSYHIPVHALSPYLQHHMVPPMSDVAYKNLMPENGGYETSGVQHGIAPNQYNPHLPLAVHNRYRRSNSEERNGATQGVGLHEVNVATKSSLVDDGLPVVDLQGRNKKIDGNFNEKSVNTRQSGSLLGLNPSNMYPMYQQYHTAEMDQKLNPHREITSQQTLSQINARATTKQQTKEPQVVTYTQTVDPQVNDENVQQSASQQEQQRTDSTERSFPDSRPISTTPSSLPAEASKKNSQSETSKTAKYTASSKNKEVIGAKLGDRAKVDVVKHLNQHERFKGSSYVSGESYVNKKPGYMVHNVGRPNYLAMVPTTGIQQQLVRVYQLPAGRGTNYSPNVHQNSLPLTYPGNYLGNYFLSYNQNSPASLPITICVETPDNAQFSVYQLV